MTDTYSHPHSAASHLESVLGRTELGRVASALHAISIPASPVAERDIGWQAEPGANGAYTSVHARSGAHSTEGNSDNSDPARATYLNAGSGKYSRLGAIGAVSASAAVPRHALVAPNVVAEPAAETAAPKKADRTSVPLTTAPDPQLERTVRLEITGVVQRLRDTAELPTAGQGFTPTTYGQIGEHALATRNALNASRDAHPPDSATTQAIGTTTGQALTELAAAEGRPLVGFGRTPDVPIPIRASSAPLTEADLTINRMFPGKGETSRARRIAVRTLGALAASGAVAGLLGAIYHLTQHHS